MTQLQATAGALAVQLPLPLPHPAPPQQPRLLAAAALLAGALRVQWRWEQQPEQAALQETLVEAGAAVVSLLVSTLLAAQLAWAPAAAAAQGLAAAGGLLRPPRWRLPCTLLPSAAGVTLSVQLVHRPALCGNT